MWYRVTVAALLGLRISIVAGWNLPFYHADQRVIGAGAETDLLCRSARCTGSKFIHTWEITHNCHQQIECWGCDSQSVLSNDMCSSLMLLPDKRNLYETELGWEEVGHVDTESFDPPSDTEDKKNGDDETALDDSFIELSANVTKGSPNVAVSIPVSFLSVSRYVFLPYQGRINLGILPGMLSPRGETWSCATDSEGNARIIFRVVMRWKKPMVGLDEAAFGVTGPGPDLDTAELSGGEKGEELPEFFFLQVRGSKDEFDDEQSPDDSDEVPKQLGAFAVPRAANQMRKNYNSTHAPGFARRNFGRAREAMARTFGNRSDTATYSGFHYGKGGRGDAAIPPGYDREQVRQAYWRPATFRVHMTVSTRNLNARCRGTLQWQGTLDESLINIAEMETVMPKDEVGTGLEDRLQEAFSMTYLCDSYYGCWVGSGLYDICAQASCVFAQPGQLNGGTGGGVQPMAVVPGSSTAVAPDSPIGYHMNSLDPQLLNRQTNQITVMPVLHEAQDANQVVPFGNFAPSFSMSRFAVVIAVMAFTAAVSVVLIICCVACKS